MGIANKNYVQLALYTTKDKYHKTFIKIVKGSQNSEYSLNVTI